ncbi:MAG: oligosaccharide flippase family protein [Bacteroidia bacterium]|nr:oligosaccharide flippase family protein [Bacteroidia bacterium]
MKTLQRDFILVVLANLLSKPLWLIVDNLAQNRIGHESYGIIGALLGLGQWAAALADWGLYVLVTREMARSLGTYRSLSGFTLTLKLILTLLSAAVFMGLGWIIGYRGKAFIWLVALLGYQLSLSYLQYFRAFFQGAQRFRLDALLSAAEKAVVLILLAGLWGMLDGDTYVGVLLTAGMLTAIGTGVGVWHQYGLPVLQAERRSLWAIFRQMTPFALLSYASTLNERLNQVLLERWVGPYANGLYWGAYRWFAAAMMYLWIVLPMFFARFAKLGRQRGTELWRTFVWGQLVSALPIVAVAGLFVGTPQFFLILFTSSSSQEISEMAKMLQVSAIPLLINGLTAIYGTYLTAVGYEWVCFWVMLGASFTNFVSCALMLPLLSGLGAVIALGLSYLFYSAGLLWIFKAKAPVPVPSSTLMRLGGLSVLYVGGLFGIGQVSQSWLAFISAVPLFIGSGWLVGLFRDWRYANRRG